MNKETEKLDKLLDGVVQKNIAWHSIRGGHDVFIIHFTGLKRDIKRACKGAGLKFVEYPQTGSDLTGTYVARVKEIEI